ncbi:mandelate racemase [bacterium]|nr:MAG: mandelate racemase [bacterium]
MLKHVSASATRAVEKDFVITDIDIRMCRNHDVDPGTLAHVRQRALDFLVVTITTQGGLQGHSFGFSARGAEAGGHVAAASIKPFFIGKDALARERHWHDFRSHDRWWNLVPTYAYSPFDICLWDIAAQAAGLPLYRLLGEYRRRVPVYGSSFVLPSVDAYAAQAAEVKSKGWHAYKIHPPGDPARDLEIYRACRDAVGPEFALMADPVAAYTYPQALRIGRELERLGYLWLEEPVFDVDAHSQRKLAAALDIPICGTEVLAGNHYAIANYIANDVVDIVRSDVSWKGGVTPVLKTAHLAESFGMQCEIHTSIYHAMEIVNLHCCSAIANCTYFELLVPTTGLDCGLKAGLVIDSEGFAHPPSTPGLGIEFDWDAIDRMTVGVL